MSAGRSPQWSMSPKHILRAAAVAEVTSNWTPGAFAEFGVGTGTMTKEFVARGFYGSVYDVGESARDALRADAFPDGSSVSVVDDPAEIPPGSVDYLLAFEVLEHVVEDLATLRQWSRVLRPGGRVLVSVPAHQRKFSATDARVGHVRRYERDALVALLAGAGFCEIRIVNYGFPLGNLTRVVMRRLERLGRGPSREDQFSRSVRSGVEQPALINALSPVISARTLAPFLKIQRRYFEDDRGDGYIATGTLPSQSG